VEKLSLLLLTLSGWCWGAYCYRTLRLARRSQEGLLSGKKDAEALSLNRSRLINYLAHEIRTLVSAVQGGLQVVRMGQSRHSVAHWLGLLDAMAMELDALLSAVLDRDQADSGKLTPRPECLDLQPLVEQVADEFRALAEARKLTLCALPARHPVLAVTDPILFRQVIRNLVSNGLKFTRAGGVTVGVSAGLRGGLLAVLVSDSGVGLSAEQRATLFSDYVQPHPPDGISSSGLGLSISRSVARALGGDITVESTPGLGSTFTLWVPSAPADIF